MEAFIKENIPYFRQRIAQFAPAPQVSETIARVSAPETSIITRIRPLTASEVEDGIIEGVVRGGEIGEVSVYEPRQKVRGKPDLNTSNFTLDQVYNPTSSTQDIYKDRVSELVQWSVEGGTSMLLAYGQTGSGKTYTVTGLERLLVEKVMSDPQKEIHICVFEVAGNNLYDLLADRNPISVKEDAFGTMQLVGIEEKTPSTAEEFLGFIDEAKTHRLTAATTKNDTSSRSHSICRIRITTSDPADFSEGQLLLVDLAGSEASSDTSSHSKERMLETREINKSLSVLKECITKRAQWTLAKGEGGQKHAHIPFRGSKLTQVLKSAFDVTRTDTVKTIVVACIAPGILDVGHSKNTLRYAEMLKVDIPKPEPMPFDERIPMTWSNADVQEWIKKNSGKPPLNPALLAPRENGVEICRLNEDEFVRRALLAKHMSSEKARLLYFKLWTLHIDSRALMQRSVALVEEPVSQNANKRLKKIKPGMFFRWDAGENGDEGGMVMVMGREESKDGNRGYNCAAVHEAGHGVYELLVADQKVVASSQLVDEVVLKYSRETRYYHT